jgi:hypothetical protein
MKTGAKVNNCRNKQKLEEIVNTEVSISRFYKKEKLARDQASPYKPYHHENFFI